MRITISVDKLSIVKWWVDASYNTHKNCKGHTVTTMTLEEGAIISISNRQIFNVKNSAEGELAGADDALRQVIWTKHIIEAHGYTAEHSTIH